MSKLTKQNQEFLETEEEYCKLRATEQKTGSNVMKKDFLWSSQKKKRKKESSIEEHSDSYK